MGNADPGTCNFDPIVAGLTSYPNRLQQVRLSFGCMGIAGQRSLGDALAGTKTLKELELRDVSIPTDDTLEDFSQGLRANTTLDRLYVLHRDPDPVAWRDPRRLLQALAVNDTIRVLDLSLRNVEEGVWSS